MSNKRKTIASPVDEFAKLDKLSKDEEKATAASRWAEAESEERKVYGDFFEMICTEILKGYLTT
jgi:hypothetical protein